ncbi:MAG: hypothetical protein GX895_03610 [Clostridiales bacterium]|uniref:hypothetical protein n=1 Tax=Clostridium sp. N3C TaxID=1776758 RepID=UPI00092E0644|nr:hypothetical protein [Clostridium sp. N3C]NLZ47866.1 hypothetical protein [Clostridiales bacterium]SCN24338.1 hypothetical protein N3C_1781 [Clostridium sp. N3C]
MYKDWIKEVEIVKRLQDIILLISVIALVMTTSFNKGGVSASISSGGNIVDKSIGNEPVSHQQSKAQVAFFQQVVDEFGPSSLEELIRLWTKGDAMRNGVYKYAVSCKELKEEIVKKWGKAEENYWIIGGSSPWLAKYEVLEKKKIDKNNYEVKIKYYWETSAGPSDSTEEVLLISKINDKWCVKDIKEANRITFRD